MSLPEIAVDEVSAAIREVGQAEGVPRFKARAAEDVIEKSPGDLVTVADRECERVLSQRLREIRDALVVGEEATAADPSLLNHVSAAPACWIIDPIDGTSNFVKGDPNFVVMVAYTEDGVTQNAWTWHPPSGDLMTAQLGNGVQRNNAVLEPTKRRDVPAGILKSWLMGKPAHERLSQLPADIGRNVPAIGSAGVEYGALVQGQIDFLLYWRTLPWDHAAGALMAAEAGLTVARPDGTAYEPGDGRQGLLSAPPELWPRLAAQINAALAL